LGGSGPQGFCLVPQINGVFAPGSLGGSRKNHRIASPGGKEGGPRLDDLSKTRFPEKPRFGRRCLGPPRGGTPGPGFSRRGGPQRLVVGEEEPPKRGLNRFARCSMREPPNGEVKLSGEPGKANRGFSLAGGTPVIEEPPSLGRNIPPSGEVVFVMFVMAPGARPSNGGTPSGPTRTGGNEFLGREPFPSFAYVRNREGIPRLSICVVVRASEAPLGHERGAVGWTKVRGLGGRWFVVDGLPAYLGPQRRPSLQPAGSGLSPQGKGASGQGFRGRGFPGGRAKAPVFRFHDRPRVSG